MPHQFLCSKHDRSTQASDPKIMCISDTEQNNGGKAVNLSEIQNLPNKINFCKFVIA